MDNEKNLNEENLNEEVTPEETSVEETPVEEAPAEETVAEEAPVEEAPVEETPAPEAPAEDAIEAAEGEFIAGDSAQSALGDNENAVDGNTESTADFAAAEAVSIVKESEKKSVSKSAVTAIIVAAVVVVALIVIIIVKFGTNSYNRKYPDTSGMDISEVADQLGMSVDEFLEYYDLPSNMPANTSETAAFYTIPFKTVAEKVYGSDMDTLLEQLEIDEEIPEDATYVEVIDKAKVKVLVAEGQLDAFKEHYGFGDEVTEDTLWGEIRQAIDEQDEQERLEEEKAAKEAEEAAADENTNSDAENAEAGEAENTEAENAETGEAAAE